MAISQQVGTLTRIVHHGDTEHTEKTRLAKNLARFIALGGCTQAAPLTVIPFACILRDLCVSVVGPEFSGLTSSRFAGSSMSNLAVVVNSGSSARNQSTTCVS